MDRPMKTGPVRHGIVHDGKQFQGLGVGNGFVKLFFVEQIEVVTPQIDKGVPAVCIESSGGPTHFNPTKKIVLLDGVHCFCVVVQFGVEQVP